jgi:UDP-glucose 4-epimerase
VFLVTGGAGFIGSHLVERLVARGEAVRVFDDFSSGCIDNLAAVRDRIALVEGDLRDRDAVRRAVADVRVVFHQAALSSVQRSIVDPRTTLEVNVTGTLNLLEAARDAGCQRLVFASSAAVYGDAPGLPKVETMAPHPLSPYAISKLAGEQLCSVFTRVHGLETVALRYFNVFGPRQDPSSPYSGVISRFLLALGTGGEPVIYGDGEQSRDFVYVDDVVDANLGAAFTPEAAGRVFNVASGCAVSLQGLLELMAAVMGRESGARHEPERAGDIRHSRADITQAQNTLGYAVTVPLKTGLARLVSACAR